MQINNQQLQWGLWNFYIYKEAKIFINIEIAYFLAIYLFFIFFLRKVITFASPAIILCIYAAAFIQRSPSTLLTLVGWRFTEHLQRQIMNYYSQFTNWEMFAQKDWGILFRDEGWEYGKAVAESGSCDYRNRSPSGGLHHFQDVVRGTRVTAITDGLNYKHISHFVCTYCRLQ